MGVTVKIVTLCAYDDPAKMRRGLLNLAIMSAFARKTYPDAQVFFLYRDGQEFDPKIAPHARPVKVNFRQDKLGYQRMQGQYFWAHLNWDGSDDLIFCGTDITILKPIEWPDMKNHAGAYAYRYHPAMPYNDDFSYWRKERREDALDIMQEITVCAEWMPRENHPVFAGQIALGVVLGTPHDDQWGSVFSTPRRRQMAALPAIDYLHTPEDFFPMHPREFKSGQVVLPAFDRSDFAKYWEYRYTLHFKGPHKKAWLLEFAKWSWQQGLIDPFINDLATPEEMFGETP